MTQKHKSAYDRLEDERVARRIRSKRAFAIDVLGLDSKTAGATYNNWRQRGVPAERASSIAGKLRWSLDYLWKGKKDDTAIEDTRDERIKSVEEIASRLPPAGLDDLLKFAAYLDWRDTARTSKRKDRSTVGEKKGETQRS